MHTNECAGALAIQIQVPDMKLSARAIEFGFVVTVNSASQTKLRIVRDLQRIVVIVCFDHGEHGSKYLFLLDRRTRLDVSDHSRLDEKSLLTIGTAADQYASTFTLPFFDVRVDRLERLIVNHSAHARSLIGRIGKLDLRRAIDNLFEHLVVNARVDDRARTRRTLLPLKSEC